MKNKGFTLIEILAVLAIILLIGAMALPRITNFIMSYTLDSAARRYLIDAQAVRQRAVIARTGLRIEYINSVPPIIRVMGLSPAVELTEFRRELPRGLSFEHTQHATKMVTFDLRGEASWAGGGATYTVTIRATNGEAMRFIFHRAGRIMLQTVP